MTMTTKTAENPTSFEEAAAARWLATTLAQARIDTKNVPSADAVDRIRARVFGPEPAQKARSIAA